MKIISWNVNGIRAIHRKELFIPFVNKYKPDILCLQETKAEQHQNEVDLSEYEEYWNSAIKKGYSGTAIFSKKSLGKPISVILNIPQAIAKKYMLADKYGETNSEGRVITVEFKDFYVVTVYTVNSKDDLTRIPLRHKSWDPAFLEFIKSLESGSLSASGGKPVIFCGDLNVAHTPDDLARPKENEGMRGFTKEEREGIQKYIDNKFVDTFRIFTKGNGHYSWWSNFGNSRARNVGWRIDYIFVSEKLAKKIKLAQILPEVMGSDHCPVLIEI